MTTSNRARRQSGANPAWGHGRSLILRAARDLFTEKGFSATSTREIAARATVTEPMLFRHFGSKAGLFEEAVLQPVSEFMSDFIDEWERRPRAVRDTFDEALDFYRRLCEVLHEHRHLVRALLAADLSGELHDDDEGTKIGAIIERFEAVTTWEGEHRNLRSFDPAVVARLAFGMAFSATVLGDWMFNGSSGRVPGQAEFVREMALLTTHGVVDHSAPIEPDIDRVDGERSN